MDAESLVQIEQIVITAVNGAEGRLRQEFGEKTDALAGSLRKDFGERTDALGASLRQEIGEKTDALAGSLRKDFGERTDALGASLRQEVGEKLNEKFEEAERHSRVLFEEMGRRLDLVVEGHQALNQKIERLEAKMEHEFLEMRALIQLSYRQLQERVETLEQRVQFIEKRLGLSA
jgi:polyhydroxyalkanoate synthesis regulator phasin